MTTMVVMKIPPVVLRDFDRRQDYLLTVNSYPTMPFVIYKLFSALFPDPLHT